MPAAVSPVPRPAAPIDQDRLDDLTRRLAQTAEAYDRNAEFRAPTSIFWRGRT